MASSTSTDLARPSRTTSRVRSRGLSRGTPALDLGTERWDAVGRAVASIAAEDPDIRLALIVGSRARARIPADRWSDLDVVLFARNPTRLLRSRSWMRPLGAPAISFVEETAVGGSRERRVLYPDGVDVDFAVFPVAALSVLFRTRAGRTVLQRGYRVLVDKDRRSATLRHTTSARLGALARSPRSAEFERLVADFWYHSVWVAKKLRRGEVWTAKSACDGHLKQLLLRMLEWDAAVRSGGRADTWHSGRFLERWADPRILRRLRGSFARYDAREVAAALRQTMDLFHDVAVRTARASRLPYDAGGERVARRIVSLVSRERPGNGGREARPNLRGVARGTLPSVRRAPRPRQGRTA